MSHHRLLAVPERVAVEKPRRTMTAQMGDDDPVPRSAQPGGDIHIAVNVIRPAVEEHHDGPIGGAGFGVANIQDTSIDVLHRTERPVRARILRVHSGQLHFILSFHRSS